LTWNSGKEAAIAPGQAGEAAIAPEQAGEADRETLAHMRANAEKGDAQFQSVLGSVYLCGHLSVAKDEVEAVKWFRRAAEQNDAAAQYNLGNCYRDGKGVEKDAVEAVKWYRKAAERNHAEAQFNLGHCYNHGEGVAQNYVEGYKWWLLAAAQGAKYVKAAILMAEIMMTREQITEAQRRARKFKPK